MAIDKDATSAAAAAVHAGKEEAERWFEIITEQYDALDPVTGSWDQFKAAFKPAAEGEDYSPGTVDYFIEYVGALDDPIGVIDQIANEEEREAVLSAYTAKYPYDGSPPPPESVPVAEDENAFYAYLKAEWDKRWDGKDETWNNYADWVVHGATEKGFPKSAAGWRTYCESAPDTVAALAEYELSVEGAAVEVSEELPPVLEFNPAELESELIDEGQLAEAVDSGALRFEPIDEDELELEMA
jgi:hypothetical protein